MTTTALTIVGPGRHGTAIAQLFASHGVDVTLYHHRPAAGQAAQAAVSRVAAPGTVVALAETLAEAVDASPVIALTTLWDAPQREVLGEVGDRLVGKVLLDVSNPLDVTPQGIQMRRPAEGSAGQFVATLLQAGTGHAKAFSNLPTATINAAADLQPPAVLPFLADSAATANTIAALLAKSGWQPAWVGDISQSANLEIGGKYNRVEGRWGRAALTPEEFTAQFGPALEV